MNLQAILLVEDNPSDIGLTKRALGVNSMTNELVVARDGQEALDYLFGTGPHAGRDTSQTPAIILMDLKLPVVDGLEVLRQVRAHPQTHNIPIIILTSSKEEKDITASYDLGANSFIRKPIDFKQFTEVIRQFGLYWLVFNEPPPQVRVP